jgi:hypothetical protein
MQLIKLNSLDALLTEGLRDESNSIHREFICHTFWAKIGSTQTIFPLPRFQPSRLHL